MAVEGDPSDLFAIPDFWRPSNCLNPPSNPSDDSIGSSFHGVGLGKVQQNPLFTLHVPDASSFQTTQGLIETGQVRVLKRPRDDDDNGGNDVFFKLPVLLRELADRSQPVTDQGAKPAAREVEAEPGLGGPLLLEEEEDLWLSRSNDPDHPCELKTWEGFEHTEQASLPSLFITEAGPAAFDALLAANPPPNGNSPADVLDVAVYSGCLLFLSLGRSSILFAWDPERNSFVKPTPHLRISGLSLDLTQAVDRLCLDCGNAARHLQAFVEATYSTIATPTKVALAKAVDNLLTAVRSELNNRSRQVRSFLQLQSAVQPAHSVLSYFKALVKKLAQQRSDEGVLSYLFEEAQACEYRDELLRELTRELLRIISKPWTDFVEEWIGLKAEEVLPVNKKGPGKSFIKVADKTWIDDEGFELEEVDYFLDEDKIPVFFSGDMAQAVYETGRNLRFLREHHPQHPLSKPDVITRMMPQKLAWEFDWDAISKLEARAAHYHKAVSSAIHGIFPETQDAAMGTVSWPQPDVAEVQCFGRNGAQVEANILASMQRLDQPLEDRGPQDGLTRLLKEGLYRTGLTPLDSAGLSPHWALVPLLSFGPVIEAQSNLVNQECMKLLFTSHHLRTHIDLLRQYFLLGNGVLCSRLSHALFDPNLDTAERRAGVALGGGVMGLRLGGRQTWPPASSELRLALMGVLSECYEPLSVSHHLPRPSRGARSDLPGNLSFAVRDLSPEEIDRCMDPDSLEALDFLRLSYTAPAPLRPVLPPTLLLKYDRVFKLLLRVLRMLYVANELLVSARNERESEDPTSARFRFEARHFVGQVAAYFFDGGITAPWRRFERWLDAVEAEALSSSSSDDSVTQTNNNPAAAAPIHPTTGMTKEQKTYTTTTTPAALRARHEQTLDEILAALLLRKRQAPVLRLLEETFAVVLRFAKQEARGDGGGGGGGPGGGEESAEGLYTLFRKKVEVFVVVCKGLGEKMGVGGDGGRGGGGAWGIAAAQGGGGNPVEQLVTMVDMSGFYSGRRGGGGV